VTADWRKAPRALLDAPPLLVGALVAALLVAFAASSALLFTSAAGSAAFADTIKQVSPLGAGVHVERTSFVGFEDSALDLREHDARGRRFVAEVGGPGVGTLRDALMSDPLSLAAGARTMDVRLVARTGATAHVRKLRGDGNGVWIADTVAAQLRLEPGDVFAAVAPEYSDARVQLRVGAIYRALWKDVANDDWVNFANVIYPRGVDPDAPPTFVLTSRAQLVGMMRTLQLPEVTELWEVPVDVRGMTLDRGRSLAHRFERFQAQLPQPGKTLYDVFGCVAGGPFRHASCDASSSLTAAVHLADQSADAVSAPSRLLGGIGLAIALGVAAAVGVFLVARRRAEARHRFARGESAAVFAARTTVETLPVLLLGGAAGFGLTLLLVRVVEPKAVLDGRALGTAAAGAAIALLAGELLLVSAATASFRRQFETDPRGIGRLRLVPWELAALGAGIYLLATLDGGSGGHPSLPVFAVPLLLLAGVTGLVLRVVRRALRHAGGGGLATYLALRRAAAGPALLVALTILCAVALGALFYGRSLSASLDHGTRAKAHAAIGGDVQGSVDSGAQVPRLAFPVTVVQVAYGGAAIGGPAGDQVDLMEVDPPSLRGAIHWDSGWGTEPDFARLGEVRDGKLPAVLVRHSEPLDAIWLSGERVPIRVVGHVDAFPGMSPDDPTVVVSRRALFATAGGGTYDPLEGGLAFVWARGPAKQVERALSASLLRPEYFVSVDDVLGNRDVVAARRTYSFLTGLGVAVASLALVGVALYLYARQRGQAVASALARRMGLARRVEVVSLWLELTVILLGAAVLAAVVGLAAAAPVVRRTDPLPKYAPAPSFVAPWSVVVATVAALVVVALVAAVATSLAARRTNVAEELRLV
jgi:hypothetical protein